MIGAFAEMGSSLPGGLLLALSLLAEPRFLGVGAVLLFGSALAAKSLLPKRCPARPQAAVASGKQHGQETALATLIFATLGGLFAGFV